MSRRTAVTLIAVAGMICLFAAGCASTPDADSMTAAPLQQVSTTLATPMVTETPTTAPPAQGCADVIAVDVIVVDDTFTFATTVRSDETGWDKYADSWEIWGPDGAVLGSRVLAHPHVDEQPFTRSLTSVEIPASVVEVSVAAHDLVLGFCGATMIVQLPGR